MKALTIGAFLLAIGAFNATTTNAQELNFYVEGRGGAAVPTFDITDAADPGPAFGAGFGINPTSSIWLIADADFGFHKGANGGADVNVYHMMGKFGYDLLGNSDGPWSVILTAGAGALMFDATSNPPESANTRPNNRVRRATAANQY